MNSIMEFNSEVIMGLVVNVEKENVEKENENNKNIENAEIDEIYMK